MKDELLNLFNIPNIIVKIPTIWLLKNSMIDNKKLYNAHLMVRYKTVEAYFNNDNKWWEIYNDMQRKRVSQKSIIPRQKAENEENFKNLIKSIQQNGFDENNPIIINRKFRLIDGSHRLTLALYFNIPYVPVTMNKETIDMDPEYSLRWFKENGYEDIVDEIINTYNCIVNKGD